MTTTAYQPKAGERYWCLRGMPTRVDSHLWENDRLDQLLRDTGRTFKTEAEARTALAQAQKEQNPSRVSVEIREAM
ncbi:hypothetical protein [Variovorax ginsengisoli]|uniref:Uncharacterized protein n=1 Tax=Variovorax ginsengisoli TaxID=363844 RepID=A0ABT8SDI1_9BURK|nr:hypothetical protein [Variovorax ginsengisoli]MDN8617809.1 hypothetical protein [Variovorax ginsengisoli]MDO1536979.1 hypothetical protein [Variovorax ginsengisoli]